MKELKKGRTNVLAYLMVYFPSLVAMYRLNVNAVSCMGSCMPIRQDKTVRYSLRRESRAIEGARKEPLLHGGRGGAPAGRPSEQGPITGRAPGREAKDLSSVHTAHSRFLGALVIWLLGLGSPHPILAEQKAGRGLFGSAENRSRPTTE